MPDASSGTAPLTPAADSAVLTERFSAAIAAGAYWLFVVSVAALVLTPILFLIYGSFQDDTSGAWTVQNWVRLVGSDMGRTINNTLIVGVVSAAVSTVIGAVLAWLLERTDVAFSRTCAALILASFALPGFILAMAWIIIGSKGGMVNAALETLFGPEAANFDIYSREGVIFVLCLHLIPISFLTMRGPIRNLDASLEEAASMCGASNARTMLKIVIPLLRYPLGSAFLLSFVLGVEQFAIPALVGVPSHFNVLSTDLYSLVVFQPPRQGAAAALGLLLAGITSLALIAHAQIARRTSAVTVTGKSYRRVSYSLGWARIPVTIFCFLPAVGAAIVPVAALTYTALVKFPVSNPLEASYTLRAFTTLFTVPGMTEIIWNTFVVCAAATVLSVFMGFVIAYCVQRKGRTSAVFLQSLGGMAFGFPGIVMGLGFIWSYVYLPIYGTLLALTLAFSGRYLAYAVETTTAAFRQLDVSLEEAAHVAGASGFATMKRVLLPLLRPALQSGSLLLFVTFLREMSASALLFTPSTQILSISIWQSFEHANWARASVLSLLVIAIVLAVSAVVSRGDAKANRHAATT